MQSEGRLGCVTDQAQPGRVLAAVRIRFSVISNRSGTPWMKRWLDHDADEIHRALTAEWSDIRHPSVGRFREVVLTFHPFALAHHEGRWYLSLKHPSEAGRVAAAPATASSARNTFGTAGSKHAFGHALCLFRRVRDDAASEFYTYFYGNGHAGQSSHIVRVLVH